MFSSFSDTCFFTATINSWKHLLSNEKRISVLIDSLDYFCREKRIQLHAFVIMPNHLHLILTLGENESQLTFQRDFLKYTAQQLIKLIIENNEDEELLPYLSTQNDRIYHIWERRPRWIPIDNALIFEQKMQYVHENPVQEKWSLSNHPEDYAWSSASYYMSGDSSFYFLTDIDD